MLGRRGILPQVPDSGRAIVAGGEYGSSIRAETYLLDDAFLLQGWNHLVTGGRVPNLGGTVLRRGNHPQTVSTESRAPNLLAMPEQGSHVLKFFFSSRRRHTRCSRDWSSDVCSSDLKIKDTVLRPQGISRFVLPGARYVYSLMQGLL